MKYYLATISNITYLGCYADCFNYTRDLAYGYADFSSYNSATVCYNHCSNLNLTYAATQYMYTNTTRMKKKIFQIIKHNYFVSFTSQEW
jgi:hypothetical protein